MTILEEALNGNITKEMFHVAEIEKIEANKIMRRISKGKLVLMNGNNVNPLGIGFPLRTKINVNLGTSSSTIDTEEEMEKVRIAQKYGADTLSDLSMGGDIDSIRKKILKCSNLPLITVPIYQTVIEANSLTNISEDLLWNGWTGLKRCAKADKRTARVC